MISFSLFIYFSGVNGYVQVEHQHEGLCWVKMWGLWRSQYFSHFIFSLKEEGALVIFKEVPACTTFLCSHNQLLFFSLHPSAEISHMNWTGICLHKCHQALKGFKWPLQQAWVSLTHEYKCLCNHGEKRNGDTLDACGLLLTVKW